MKKVDEGYITPEEVKARGIIRRKDGTFYLLNTLEKYADKGWLNFGDKRFDKDFRLDAAQMFHRDFMESRISDMAITKNFLSMFGMPAAVLLLRLRLSTADIWESLSGLFWKINLCKLLSFPAGSIITTLSWLRNIYVWGLTG